MNTVPLHPFEPEGCLATCPELEHSVLPSARNSVGVPRSGRDEWSFFSEWEGTVVLAKLWQTDDDFAWMRSADSVADHTAEVWNPPQIPLGFVLRGVILQCTVQDPSLKDLSPNFWEEAQPCCFQWWLPVPLQHRLLRKHSCLGEQEKPAHHNRMMALLYFSLRAPADSDRVHSNVNSSL